MDPYAVLGLPPAATVAEAEAAYRELAEQFERDRQHAVRPSRRHDARRRLREVEDAINEIRDRAREAARRAAHPPSRAPAAGRVCEVELRSVDGPGLHARWDGRHGAATHRAIEHAHDDERRPVGQVEWGADESVLPGAERT